MKTIFCIFSTGLLVALAGCKATPQAAGKVTTNTPATSPAPTVTVNTKPSENKTDMSDFFNRIKGRWTTNCIEAESGSDGAITEIYEFTTPTSGSITTLLYDDPTCSLSSKAQVTKFFSLELLTSSDINSDFKTKFLFDGVSEKETVSITSDLTVNEDSLQIVESTSTVKLNGKEEEVRNGSNTPISFNLKRISP